MRPGWTKGKLLSIAAAMCWPIFGSGSDSGHSPARLVVDANLDGILHVPGMSDPRSPADETSAEQPFVFWTNYDQDDRHYFETVPVKKPDFDDEMPNSRRDLEDLARLHVDLGSSNLEQLPAGARLVLKWADATGAPGIRLFLSADPAGSERYITNEDEGLRQRELPFLNALGKADVPGNAEIDLRALPASHLQGRRLCLLFEGTSEGSGELQGRIEMPGRDPDQLAPVHLAIRHPKNLYQRIRVEWPYRLPPWSHISGPPPEVNLSWADDPMDYPFEKPWYETRDAIVMIVGWTRETREGYMKSVIEALETTFKRLWHRGYKGRFIVFRWDTRKYLMGFGLTESEYRAYKAGAPLVDFVHSLPSDYTKHVMGHSMGGIVLLEGLKQGLTADSALFLQSVVATECIDPRPELYYPNAAKVVTPDLAKDFGLRGYLTESKTPVYNFFNQEDIAFMGWDNVQRGVKPTSAVTRAYVYRPDLEPEKRIRLRSFFFWHRPVTDPHESMALVARPRTYAIGAEPRVQGVVEESFDLNGNRLAFGAEHGAQFSRDIQETTAFYDLLLDTFGMPFRGVEP